MSLAPGPIRDAAFRALARPSGGMAMVAIDQRESLRAMLSDGDHRVVADAELVEFKHDVARALSRSASALLVDRELGLPAIESAGVLAPSCGLIVAADRLEQAPGGPVRWTSVDHDAPAAALRVGAHALKLLVPWRSDRSIEDRARLVHEFLAVCREHALLALVEAIVQDDGRHDAAWYGAAGVLAAAEEMADLDPDVYKAQVPTLGYGSPAEIEALSAQVSRAIGRPWVVLSQGVPPERFEVAVEAACRGGASGFLAGRAIWTSALGADDRVAHLADVSATRLERLIGIVDSTARPWAVALADGPARGGSVG